MSTDLKTELAALAAELGFARFGVARAERLEPEGSYLARYVAEGRHGSMGWLADTAAVRADPRHEGMLPSARSVLVFAAPLRPGEWMAVEIDLDTTTWTLQPGHTLRLSIAGTDWPNCWPPPGPVTIGVDVASIGLSVPLVDGLPESVHAFTPGPGPSDDEAEGVVWRIERDVLARETRAITRYGGTYEGQHGATVTDDYRGELGVSTVNPALAWARGSATFEIRWPEATVRAESTLSVQSDDDSFDVELSMVAVEIGDAGQEIEVARRTWSTSFPR